MHRGLQLFADAATTYEQLGDLRGQARAWAHLGNASALGGDQAAATRCFDRGLVLAKRSGDQWYEAFSLYLSGYGAIVVGDAAMGRARASRAADLFAKVGDGRAVGYSLVVVSAGLVGEGALAEAAPLLREQIVVFDALLERWGVLYAATLLASASAGLGEWPQVATLAGVIDSLRERTGSPLFPYIKAAVDSAVDRAEAALGSAMAGHRELGRAIGRSDGIAAALWPDPKFTPQPSVAALPLSGRESAVAELMAVGLTNRQIGARLFIAERTVDTHVGRILAKLGCANRSQVAALVAASRAPSSSG